MALNETQINDHRFSINQETIDGADKHVVRFCGGWLGLVLDSREQAEVARIDAIKRHASEFRARLALMH